VKKEDERLPNIITIMMIILIMVN